MPRGIQRREKFTTLPMKGTSTSEGSRYGFPPSEVCAYEASVLAGFHVLQPTSYKEADDPVTGKKYDEED